MRMNLEQIEATAQQLANYHHTMLDICTVEDKLAITNRLIWILDDYREAFAVVLTELNKHARS